MKKRYLSQNYLDCPVLDYSKIAGNDYGAAKKDCGKNQTKNMKKKKNNKNKK